MAGMVCDIDATQSRPGKRIFDLGRGEGQLISKSELMGAGFAVAAHTDHPATHDSLRQARRKLPNGINEARPCGLACADNKPTNGLGANRIGSQTMPAARRLFVQWST
jgi:ribosomal protein L11 methylase PrmA